MRKISNPAWTLAPALILIAIALATWSGPDRSTAAAAGGPGVSAAATPPAALPAARLVGAQALPPIYGYQFKGDVRRLPAVPSTPLIRMAEEPLISSRPALPAGPVVLDAPVAPSMPAPLASFEGMAFNTGCTGGNCGAGYPPDTVGDVGPNHYVEAVNTAIGIYSKAGVQLAAFTFNSLWSMAHTGTACDANHQGDPTVVYDPLGDRWIVADFAFTDPNASTPPFYECLAVSNSGDPVAGGWTFFPLRADDAAHPWLPDYPKMAVWTDGIYLTANEFLNAATFQGVRIWAINRTQLESGILNAQVKDLGPSVYSVLPANLRGAPPPAGAPAYLASQDSSGFFYDVYTLSVNWGNSGLTVLAGPSQVTEAPYGNPWDSAGSSDIIPQSGTSHLLDTIGDRFMMQLQYRNLGGAESLWLAHTVRPANATSGPTAVQWAQLNVTGGTIRAAPVQQQIFTNGGDGLYRWVPSIAVDAAGNTALGYSTSSSATFPSIRWAGRLVGDPLNTLGQGEGTLLTGTGSESFNCGTGPCSRWGDYSAMTVDPVDGCTFWYVNEYYPTTGNAVWHTRIGSFKFPGCPPLPPTLTPTSTPSNAPTNTPTSTPTLTSTPTNTPTSTPTLTSTPTNTPTGTQSSTPTNTPTGTPTSTPTPNGTAPSVWFLYLPLVIN